eukprot:COSAG02_NODE_53755_length_300_cov_0.412935_1_plen_27_part_10
MATCDMPAQAAADSQPTPLPLLDPLII